MSLPTTHGAPGMSTSSSSQPPESGDLDLELARKQVLDTITSSEIKRQNTPPTTPKKTSNPVKHFWRHTAEGITSALDQKTPSQLGRDATKLAEASEKSAQAAEKKAKKAEKNKKTDRAAKWKEAKESWETAKQSWEHAKDTWGESRKIIQEDQKTYEIDAKANPSDKKISANIKKLQKKLEDASKCVGRAEDKVEAVETKINEIAEKLKSLNPKEEESLEEVETASEEEGVSVEEEEFGDKTFGQYGTNVSKGSNPTSVSSTNKGEKSSGCDWVDIAAKVAIAVGIVIAAFGALCLAGIFPQAFLGGLVGAITVTSASVLLAVVGLGVVLKHRGQAKKV